MTTDESPQVQAWRKVEAFAIAANNLLALWEGLDHEDPVNELLTRTYPACIGMSFDEFAAELGAWSLELGEAIVPDDGRS